jgi:uncharacterized membrane protein (TIGR01666 family)
MDYVKEYRSFISSHYLNEGVRITVGVLTPVLLLGNLGMLETGIAVGLGALAVSITDSPGPIHHRRNGMIACAIIVFLVALITGISSRSSWLFLVLLPVFSFFFSMIGVYGARVTSIGLATLLIMVLQTQHELKGWQLIYNSLYMLAGSCWYILFSLLLYQIRPYKLIQQALGEYAMAAAGYLRSKGRFYDEDSDPDKNYSELLQTQIQVQEKQNLLAELLFKTRSVVKESTNTSRALMMIFLDINDLFERAMTAHQDYEKLHNYFRGSDIMERFHSIIRMLANDLDEIGIALQSGRSSRYNELIDKKIMEEREHLHELRQTDMNPTNIEGFISLRHILDSIQDIASRIRTLHQYTSSKTKVKKRDLGELNPSDFVSSQSFDPKIFLDNFSRRSNIFRHSLRIAMAATTAWLIGFFFPLGHSYWILLTVIVILKPGFGLTRRRNIERLTGTLIGTALGAALLFLVRNNDVILVLLILSMIGAYSFIRKTYLIGVVLITIYLLLMFHLLQPHDFRTILTDRIIDTAIGSAIAFLFSYLLSPLWEHQQIDEYVVRVLHDNKDYFSAVASVFTGVPSKPEEIRLKRKDSWVSLANLSDAFNRMLTEPRSKQKNVKFIHQLVVSNHMLTSYIATLSYYSDKLEAAYITKDYQPLIAASNLSLENAINMLEKGVRPDALTKADEKPVSILDKRIAELMMQRSKEVEEGKLETATRKFLSEFKSITDQFYFIYKTSLDIQKISANLKFRPAAAAEIQV